MSTIGATRRSGLHRASRRRRPTGSDIWVQGMRETGEVRLGFMTQIKTQSRILTLAELAAKARELRAGGLAVVQAHGTFDLLHLGHVRHLEAARGFGDVLVVTV